MDLSTLPTRMLLRWELGARVLLAVGVPLIVQVWRTGSALGPGLVAALVAALISVACLGPELRSPSWLAVAAVGVPVAVVGGAVLGASPTGGVVWVFVLYLVLGAITRAGLISQLAWNPVAIGGLLASVLATGGGLQELAIGAWLGALWAVLLLVAVPWVVRAPRIPVPPGALDVDTDVFRRMVRRPAAADWAYPLLLGGLAAALLVVVDVLLDGYKPYWAVFALASVLGPTASATRRSTVEVIGSALGGVLIAAVLLSSGLSTLAIGLVALLLALVGALLLLRNGLLSKLLLTPLPVIIAAAALGTEGDVALRMRLGEYLLGAGVGFLVAASGDWLSRRLSEDRPEEQAEIAT